MDSMPVILDEKTRLRFARPLGLIPQSLFIMTAAHEHRMRSLLVSWVQQVSFDPPMVAISLRKGREIVPLIHDSHAFALNQIAHDDRLVLRKYNGEAPSHEDPVTLLETCRKATGSPILSRAVSYLDCELVRHIDIDGDHDLYVGMIRDADMLRGGVISVHMREDGFSY